MKKNFVLTLSLIVSIFIVSCKKENKTSTITTTTGTTSSDSAAQQSKLIYICNKVNNSTSNSVLSVNYDGTGNTELFNFTAGQFLAYGAVSPDDKTLFFTIGDPKSFYSNLYSVNIPSGSPLTELINETSTYLNPNPIGTIPATTTQASQLLYNLQSDGSGFELHTANLDGTGDKIVSTTVGNIDGVHLFQDKKTLLLEFLGSGNTVGLATCNIDGTNSKTLGLTDGNGQNQLGADAVAGTPSQGTIFYDKGIYDSNNNFLNDEIWVSNADLSGTKKLNIILPTTDLYIGSIDGYMPISPDGKTIFFAVSSHNSISSYNRGIYSCNIDGSNVKVVVHVDLTGVNDYVPLTAY